jgi:Kef-type K+ transport system membrane component KefB
MFVSTYAILSKKNSNAAIMDIFYAILVLLVVTRACGEFAVRVRQPALVGELIAGIGLGIVVANNTDRFPILSRMSENEAFNAIVNLGIFFLMLLGGLELEPRKFAEASARAIAVAVSGFLMPLGLGFGLGWLFLPESTLKVAQCLFLGTALAITAVPVAVKVLMDIGRLHSPAGQMIVSAAVFDDVLSLVLLAILVAVVRTGAFPYANELAFLVLKIATFFAITVGLGVFVALRREGLRGQQQPLSKNFSWL